MSRKEVKKEAVENSIHEPTKSAHTTSGGLLEKLIASVSVKIVLRLE